MKTIDQNRSFNFIGNTVKYEDKATRLSWVLLFLLIIGDVFIRVCPHKDSIIEPLVILQGISFVLYIISSFFRITKIKKNGEEYYKTFRLENLIEIGAIATLISTFYYGIFMAFIFLLPIMYFCLSKGFKQNLMYIVTGSLFHICMQFILFFWLGDIGVIDLDSNLVLVSAILIFQYSMFIGFSFLLGRIHSEYLQSEEENNILIERLGDKYVQLEQAKKDIQMHYDKMRETNDQLEESNKKLTASLAEFYTLQQISQAITSIFDMNELLKFVNDVIIGVMGVYHSTIALCHGTQNKLKVQVSSIFDKKDLAIVSDYINCDILKSSTDGGHSMIDNNVNAEEYPFTQGRNIKSMICVPLLAKGNTLGIVLIEHSIKNAFDNDTVRLLEIISQQVSIAIENARLYQQMHDLATLDGLTGAYNRLFFQDKLEEEYKKAHEIGYDLSFIIFDIDHFKKFNDTYGHLFGDLVLKTLSSHIMRTLRKEDIFARYGGEEFVILLPHTTIEQAKEKAEELRISVSQLNITDRVVSASVTISIGVSTYPQCAGKSTELISTADDALYEAKHAGRNQVRTAKMKV